MTGNPLLLVIVAGIMFAVLGGVTLLSHIYSLNGIKSKTVGDDYKEQGISCHELPPPFFT